MSISSTITEIAAGGLPQRVTTHPGEVLREEFMLPLGLSANRLARALAVPPNRITAIINQVSPRAVTPDTALRLAKCFGTTARFWLNLQLDHDLSQAAQQNGARIEADVAILATEPA